MPSLVILPKLCLPSSRHSTKLNANVGISSLPMIRRGTLPRWKITPPPSDLDDHDDEPRKKKGKKSRTSTRMDDDDKS